MRILPFKLTCLTGISKTGSGGCIEELRGPNLALRPLGHWTSLFKKRGKDKAKNYRPISFNLDGGKAFRNNNLGIKLRFT